MDLVGHGSCWTGAREAGPSWADFGRKLKREIGSGLGCLGSWFENDFGLPLENEKLLQFHAADFEFETKV
jgi:hypothetical protein